jgi:hypothetical protein
MVNMVELAIQIVVRRKCSVFDIAISDGTRRTVLTVGSEHVDRLTSYHSTTNRSPAYQRPSPLRTELKETVNKTCS